MNNSHESLDIEMGGIFGLECFFFAKTMVNNLPSGKLLHTIWLFNIAMENPL